MFRLAVLALLVAVAVARDFPRWHQLQEYSFETFVRDARRPYQSGTTEWKHRQAIFNERLDDIKRHNANPAMTWKRGINHFADWTAQEWKEYNRAKPSFTLDYFDTMPLRKPAENPNPLPRYVDWRQNTNPPVVSGVKNQGSCGSCWAHSSTESVESHYALNFGQLPVLSQQQITSCDDTQSGCGGGSYMSGWDYISKNGGLNEEWTYSYTDFFAKHMRKSYTSACRNITKEFPHINSNLYFTWWPKANTTGGTRVERNSAWALKEALARVGPQSISVASSTWADYESGVLQNNYSNNASWQVIDHAVQAVGYGYDYDLNLNYWIVRNSWGTNYGEEGYIRLDIPEKEPCGNITGYTICGTSGILCDPAFPTVTKLGKDKQNGYYF